ncbi:MAG: ribosome biogenesis GTP-binding protein YihA/YsxC [Candidatus Kapaibacterium sp.]
MKVSQAEFIKGAANEEQFPDLDMPELAFAGRSNVGKSTLINSLVMRKNLAHTSSTPGKTRQINFYSVEGRWSFADLPGFGYAAIGKEHREKWANLNFAYLETRKNLSLVCALIDSRHDPMPTDLSFIEWLELNKKPYIILLTKCDKISTKMVSQRKEQLDGLVKFCSQCREVLPYSSVSGLGRKELMGIINNLSEK